MPVILGRNEFEEQLWWNWERLFEQSGVVLEKLTA
jgi:hypothetical protein